MMDRRAFVTPIAGACLLEALAVRAQQAAVPKLQKVTVLMNAVNPANGFFFALVVVNLLQRADEVIH
jgi:hypothetical protein